MENKALNIGGVLLLGTILAQASALDLSTGLDPSDTLITLGNTPDAHWSVDQPLGGIAPALVVAPGNTGAGFPIWAANGPGSSWITIDPNSYGNGSVIPYTYYRTFNLTPADLASASMAGTWGIDDEGDLKLNGNTVDTSLGNYAANAPFSVPSGSGFFVAGLNTLTITMTLSDNALEAVRLEGQLRTGNANGTVPDSGSTLTLLGASFVGLISFGRKYLRN